MFIELMRSERHRTDAASPLVYNINLVQLLALCTEGKNVYTEIKCHSLLPLDDIVRVLTHPDCIPEVSCTISFILVGVHFFGQIKLKSHFELD